VFKFLPLSHRLPPVAGQNLSALGSFSLYKIKLAQLGGAGQAWIGLDSLG
jgi:hypothetical protein